MATPCHTSKDDQSGANYVNYVILSCLVLGTVNSLRITCHSIPSMPLHMASEPPEPVRLGCMNCLCTLLVFRGSIFPHVFPIALFYSLVGGVATLLWHRFPDYEEAVATNADMHHYFNLLVGLLLVFRTTTSYQRYEAGVVSAGMLKSTARMLVSQAVAHTTTADAEQKGHVGGDATQPPAQRFITNCQRLTMLYCLMYKRHIHRQDEKPLPALIHKGLLREDELRALADAPPCTRTLLVMQWLRNIIAEAARAGLLDSSCLKILDGSVNRLLQNFQAASRVRSLGNGRSVSPPLVHTYQCI